jgi:hypothetical protein
MKMYRRNKKQRKLKKEKTENNERKREEMFVARFCTLLEPLLPESA